MFGGKGIWDSSKIWGGWESGGEEMVALGLSGWQLQVHFPFAVSRWKE